MSYIVYITTNRANGKCYIGVHEQDGNPFEFDGYLGSGEWQGKRRLGWKQSLKEAIENDGKENFERETLFYYWTEEEAMAKEAEIVTEEFVKHGWNYNLTPGGKRPPCLSGEEHPLFGLSNELRRYLNLTDNPVNRPGAREKIAEGNRKYWAEHSHPMKGKSSSWTRERNLINNPSKMPHVREMISIRNSTPWITNGVLERKLKVGEELPEGWNSGRLFTSTRRGKKNG